jgi:hypothetical protein
MSNMSYCRHENTSKDMEDIVDTWFDYEEEEASDYEQRGRQSIIELAQEIVRLAEETEEL